MRDLSCKLHFSLAGSSPAAVTASAAHTVLENPPMFPVGFQDEFRKSSAKSILSV